MKKLIVGLLAAFLMTSGLVALSAGSASAACPYTGCVATKVSKVKTSSPSPGTAKVVYKVTTVGNAVPRGKVKVSINGNGVSRSTTSPYPANNVAVFRNLRKGRYAVTVKFIPAASSAYGPSSRSAKVRVG
jgi:hypothetical protein